MLPTDACRVRPLESGDLERVLEWRNHPDVRAWMFTTHEIPLHEHLAWYERASRDPSKRLLLAEQDGEPFGYVGFSGVEPGGVAHWGFYVAPGAPKGSGRKLGRAALRFAFTSLELHKVCGQAFDFNPASIQLHLALGFRQEGVLREQQRAGDSYHSLVCFGLLQAEWTDQEPRHE